MPDPMPMSPTPSLRHAASAVLLLALPLLSVVACGGGGGSTGPDNTSIFGKWQSPDSAEASVYVVITEGRIDTYFRNGGCYEHDAYLITAQNGDTYTLTDSVANVSFKVTITRNASASTLTIEDTDGTLSNTYEQSRVDLGAIPICTPGGGGGSGFTCSALPQLAPDTLLDGSLAATDSLAPDSAYFDLYGLTLADSADIQISMHSTDVDSYLFLYEGDGTLITLDDDGGDLTAAGADDRDALIDRQLGPGCYRIEASSWAAREMGPYTLQVVSR